MIVVVLPSSFLLLRADDVRTVFSCFLAGCPLARGCHVQSVSPVPGRAVIFFIEQRYFEAPRVHERSSSLAPRLHGNRDTYTAKFVEKYLQRFNTLSQQLLAFSVKCFGEACNCFCVPFDTKNEKPRIAAQNSNAARCLPPALHQIVGLPQNGPQARVWRARFSECCERD